MIGIVKALLRFLLTVAIMVGAAVYLLQDRLLHYPEMIEPAAALAIAGKLRLTPWPDAAAPRGWLRATPQTTRGTVVLFHGNAGHALHRQWFADELERHGYATLLAEYPGYGHRPGALDEATLAADAATTIAALRHDRPGALIVAGESLGAGVAGTALARMPADAGVTGVFLMTPWNNLGAVARHYYPLVPGFLLRDQYDSVANFEHFKGRKLVLIAGRDSIIPPRLGQALFDALAPPKKLLELPHSDHNDWANEMRAETWQECLDFLVGREPLHQPSR